MFDYGVGGQERKLDIANEAIADIPINRTMMVQKLTSQPPLRPQIVQGLVNVDDVFNHYKPNVDVEFSDEDGSIVGENLQFKNVGDFTKKGLINQSEFLSGLNVQADDLQKFMRSLKSNKILKAALDNPEAKMAFLEAVAGLINELDENK
jgi:hypothetical protein